MNTIATEHLADNDETPQSAQLAILSELQTQRDTLRRKLWKARSERDGETKVRKALASDMNAIRGLAEKARIDASMGLSGVHPTDDSLARAERALAQIEALASLER